MNEPKELRFDKNIDDLCIITGDEGFNFMIPDLDVK